MNNHVDSWYQLWIKDIEKFHKEVLTDGPLFSLIVLADNTDSRLMRSIENQSYKKRELILFDNNENAVEEMNRDVITAKGNFIVFLDGKGCLSIHALNEMAWFVNKHPQYDLIYSDEDMIRNDDVRLWPFFKPDWSPDTFLSMNYIGQLSAYRTELVKKVFPMDIV